MVEGRLNGVRLVGIEPLTAPGDIAPVAVEGVELQPFLSGAGQIVGQPDVLAALEETGAELLPSTDVAPGTALTDIGVAQRLLGLEGRVTRLVLAPEQPLGRPPLEDVAPGLILRAAGTGSDIGRLTDSFHLNLTAFGLLSFAVGLFIVHGAIGLAFEQRRTIVRTMRALGAPLSRIVALMAAELLVLALVAGGIGVVLGYLIAAALHAGRGGDAARALRGRGGKRAVAAAGLVAVGAGHRGAGHGGGLRSGAVAAGAHAAARRRAAAGLGNGGGEGPGVAGRGRAGAAGGVAGPWPVGAGPGRRFRPAGGAADRRGAAAAAGAGRGAGRRRPAGKAAAGGVVLGRHAPAAAGAVASR